MSDVSFQSIRVADARAINTRFRPMLAEGDFYADRHVESRAEIVPQSETGEAAAAETNLCAQAYSDGFHAASVQFEEERAGMLALITTAQALQAEPSDEVAALIAETVERLVSGIVGRAAIDTDWLIERATRATQLIAEADAARTMWLHPDDVALLADAELNLVLMADPHAARGSIRIDCSAGWIEDGTAIHLDALRTELGLRSAE
jgi:flagellar assembly protein FliH